MQILALSLGAALFTPTTQDADLKMVDCVQVIVNDEIHTNRQILRVAVKNIPEGAQPTPKEYRALQNKVAKDLIQERLQMQGGIDMGFESEAVERIITNNMERQIDAAGGIIQMADQLDQGDLSVNESKAALRKDLYRYSWERAITGVSAGVSGRAYRDRYVRPGKIQLYHEQLQKGRLGAEAIGGTPALYSLQELLLPIPSEAEAEETRVRAEQLYSELVAGADFTKIIQSQPNPAEKDGMLPPMAGLALARNGGPEIAAFALSSAPGQLSRPMPIVINERLLGWRIMKLIKSEKPILPLFSLPQTQSALREILQRETDEHRRNVGIEALSNGAYVWLKADEKGA
jgi:hypothetical protein